jgi:hypothetical protein
MLRYLGCRTQISAISPALLHLPSLQTSMLLALKPQCFFQQTGLQETKNYAPK